MRESVRPYEEQLAELRELGWTRAGIRAVTDLVEAHEVAVETELEADAAGDGLAAARAHAMQRALVGAVTAMVGGWG